MRSLDLSFASSCLHSLAVVCCLRRFSIVRTPLIQMHVEDSKFMLHWGCLTLESLVHKPPQRVHSSHGDVSFSFCDLVPDIFVLFLTHCWLPSLQCRRTYVCFRKSEYQSGYYRRRRRRLVGQSQPAFLAFYQHGKGVLCLVSLFLLLLFLAAIMRGCPSCRMLIRVARYCYSCKFRSRAQL